MFEGGLHIARKSRHHDEHRKTEVAFSGLPFHVAVTTTTPITTKRFC
jgi:hypothetical protein